MIKYRKKEAQMKDYGELCENVRAIIHGVNHEISNLANVSALVWGALDGINWAGFYMLEGDTLVLGPFQGKAACIEIPLGRGVCGTAAKSGETVVVSDVHKFPGHIACDTASRSEIVVPIKKDGRVVGVLDIDSPELARFGERDKEGLETLVGVMEEEMYK